MFKSTLRKKVMAIVEPKIVKAEKEYMDKVEEMNNDLSEQIRNLHSNHLEQVEVVLANFVNEVVK